MNRAIEKAKKALDLVHLLPGYSPDMGKLIVEVTQYQGAARHIDIVFRIVEKHVLEDGTEVRKEIDRRMRL